MPSEYPTNMPINVQEVLDGVDLLARKASLISYAADHHAGEDTMILLRALPEWTYQDMADVNRGMGLIKPMPGEENLWSSRY